MSMEATKLPGCVCTNCGKLVDGASSFETDRSPRPGDATICVYCGHLMVFDDTMKLRELNDQEIVELAGDPRLLLMQKVRGEIKEKLS